jgi:hypothetical protein
MSHEALAQDLATLSADPYKFVLWAFPWGEAGTELAGFSGPEAWQIRILSDIRDGLLTPNTAIREAVASGHGVGKSALVAWIILWSISTLEDTRGVVTANTENQLKTKTWAELGKWHRLFLARELFKLTATALFSSERERTWRIDMVAWSERNTEAFAGLHNQGKRVVLIMDEASAIPDKIHETSEGALTDANTQILWIMFGNPTRSTGRFREAFAGGKHSKQWRTYNVDSRSVSFTNKTQLQSWIDSYGIDSDFVRIRILGLFPHHGELEFFPVDDVDAAMSREVSPNPYDPLALGVDVARFGSNSSVIYPRKGRDARTIPREVYKGLSTVALAAKVFETSQALRADGIFIDGGGVGGGVVDQVRASQLHCWDIQFGGKADSPGYGTGNQGERYANKRAEMYGALRAWLKGGAIPFDQDLRQQLLSITYTFNVNDQIILTSKEVMMREGKPSPDDVDALVLTFAYPLAQHPTAGHMGAGMKSLIETEYDPFSPERLAA